MSVASWGDTREARRHPEPGSLPTRGRDGWLQIAIESGVARRQWSELDPPHRAHRAVWLALRFADWYYAGTVGWPTGVRFAHRGSDA